MVSLLKEDRRSRAYRGRARGSEQAPKTKEGRAGRQGGREGGRKGEREGVPEVGHLVVTARTGPFRSIFLDDATLPGRMKGGNRRKEGNARVIECLEVDIACDPR